jgi:hypothetical protein
VQDCRVELINGNAEIMMASALGLYYIIQDYGADLNAVPIAQEHRGKDVSWSKFNGLSYRAVAIVNTELCAAKQRSGQAITLSTLRDLTSCHGEYGDLAGWVAPATEIFSRREKGEIDVDGNTDLDMVRNFFSKSCAPSNDEKEICSACSKTEGCDLTDKFAGPTGVIDCLRQGAGDVGFLDDITARGSGQGDVDGNGTNAAEIQNMKEFQLVCLGGCRELKHSQEVCSPLCIQPFTLKVHSSIYTVESHEIVLHKLCLRRNAGIRVRVEPE